jgi:uncharacterized protein YjbI with pentapeptide repeats
MDPVVEAALISGAATVVGVGGTVVVAIVGFRTSRSANRAALDAARDTNRAAIDAARADVQLAVETTRGGQIADLYSRAIEQLGSDKLDVRIGGIYALESVARDSARDHPTVMEVLAAFIREHSRQPLPSSDAGTQEPERSIRPDIQAAVAVIGRRETKHDIRPVDLTGANLASADLSGAHLAGANLTRAHLAAAILTDAHLADAILGGADLAGAFLAEADLAHADLLRADLTRANLFRANLADASLADADISGGPVGDATLTGAFLIGARLDGARWPVNAEVPEGWQRDAISGLMTEAGADSGPAEAD